jgi:hypothetical protein
LQNLHSLHSAVLLRKEVSLAECPFASDLELVSTKISCSGRQKESRKYSL